MASSATFIGAIEHLPRSLKLAFGAPSFAGAAMAIPIGVLMPQFYSDVVLAPLGYIAIAIALARAFDALTDPFMGWLSDRTRSRWGRRKPYIALGAPFAAIGFYALFAPPIGLSPIQGALWFGVSFTFFFLATTIVEIPFAALGAEMTPNYSERSSLFGYRSIFVATGTIIAAVLPVLAEGAGMGDKRTLYKAMALLYGAILMILIAHMLRVVPERPEFAQRESNPLVPGVRRALRNRPFRILLLSGMISAVPAAIPAMLMPYFVEYVLQVPNPLSLVGMFLLLYLGTGLIFVPVWMGLASRIGKLRTLLVTSTIGIGSSVFYFFAGPGDVAYAACIYFVGGTVAMAGQFLIPAMTADVIDYDELRTGKRREAQYMSFWSLVPKFISIPGSAIPLAVLAAVGYVPNQLQTPDVLFWISFMYSLFPAAFFVVGLIIVSRYPISEELHEVIRAGIAAHGRGDAVTDPLTNIVLPPTGTRAVDDAEGWFLDYFSPSELKTALANGP
jgi:GPH family glycoside/pentoside/hexuronide:cation symporter